MLSAALMLAAQISAGPAPEPPEVREQRIAVAGPWREVGPGRRAAEFEVPPVHGKHLRIEAIGARAVWLNGARLEGPGPDYDSGDRVAFAGSGRTNRIEVESATTIEAAVRILPRVHIAEVSLRCEKGQASGRVTVRNTLENTTNVVVRYETGAAAAESVATVPAEAWQDVAVSGACEEGGTGRIILEKEGEAMEGSYRFVAPAPARR